MSLLGWQTMIISVVLFVFCILSILVLFVSLSKVTTLYIALAMVHSDDKLIQLACSYLISFVFFLLFCCAAISLAIHRDGSSGDVVRLASITVDGLERQTILA